MSQSNTTSRGVSSKIRQKISLWRGHVLCGTGVEEFRQDLWRAFTALKRGEEWARPLVEAVAAGGCRVLREDDFLEGRITEGTVKYLPGLGEHQKVLDRARRYVHDRRLLEGVRVRAREEAVSHRADRSALDRFLPFKGKDGRKSRLGDIAPDRLVQILGTYNLWPQTRREVEEAIEALVKDPGQARMPIGTKYRGRTLAEIPDGGIRWFAEVFPWEDDRTLLCGLIAREAESRKLPRYHRDEWRADGSPSSVRVEYVLPAEELDREEDREAFVPSDQLGGLPGKKPSLWYLCSRKEKAIQQEWERQGLGRKPDTVTGYYCPVTQRVQYLWLRETRERILYQADPAMRQTSADTIRYEQEVIEQVGVTCERGRRFGVCWLKQVDEDGETKMSLRNEYRTVVWDPQEKKGVQTRTEEDLRHERSLASKYAKALEALDRMAAAPDEKELNWRSQVAESLVCQLAWAEATPQQRKEWDGEDRLPYWLHDEGESLYEQRLRQLERREVSLGLYDGPKVKEGAKRRAGLLAADLRHTRFEDTLREFRGVDSHAAWDEAVARVEGQVWDAEQAAVIARAIEWSWKHLDHRMKVYVAAPGETAGPIPVECHNECGTGESGTKRGANPTELRLVQQLQDVREAGRLARCTLPVLKAETAARRDRAWAQAILFANAQM